MRPARNDEIREGILRLWPLGLSQQQMADRLGYRKSQVHGVVSKMIDLGQLPNRDGVMMAPKPKPPVVRKNQWLHDSIAELWPEKLSHTEIAKRLGVSKGRISGAITKMKAMRLIVSHPVEPKQKLPGATIPEANPRSADGHRWDRFGRMRTCECGARQYLACKQANGQGTPAAVLWVPAVDPCKGAKRAKAERVAA